MVLIISHKEDYTVDFVIDKLNRKDISYFRLNTEDILGTDLDVQISNLVFNSSLDKFKSIWFRRIKLPILNEVENLFEKDYVLNEIDHFFTNLWAISDAKWLSEPRFIYRAENKLLQLKIAKNIGFNIPNTLVTNNPVRIHEFYIKENENIIIKPIYNNSYFDGEKDWSIYTNIVDEERINRLDKFHHFPCIYQQYIDKKFELRITVVGNEVFAAKVNSQSNPKTKIDWRKEKLKFEKYELPNEIKELCVKFIHRLNLSFGALDIIVTKEEKYVFLENNPNGQWAWIEFDTGLEISEAIINFLNG